KAHELSRSGHPGSVLTARSRAGGGHHPRRGAESMQPVPRRVVESYHIRYQLGSLLGGRDTVQITDAIDLHVHAQPGTEDPLDIAQSATRAHMGAVVFKNLPAGKPAQVTVAEVVEQLNRWAEAEDLAPVTCYHGVQTDPS